MHIDQGSAARTHHCQLCAIRGYLMLRWNWPSLELFGRAMSWFSSQSFPDFWAIHGRGVDRKWPLVGSWLHQIQDWSMYQIVWRATWLKLIGKGPLVRPSLYRYPRLYWAVINCWAFNKVMERFYPELCLLNQPTPRAFLVNWSGEQVGQRRVTLRFNLILYRIKLGSASSLLLVPITSVLTSHHYR